MQEAYELATPQWGARELAAKVAEHLEQERARRAKAREEMDQKGMMGHTFPRRRQPQNEDSDARRYLSQQPWPGSNDEDDEKHSPSSSASHSSRRRSGCSGAQSAPAQAKPEWEVGDSIAAAIDMFEPRLASPDWMRRRGRPRAHVAPSESIVRRQTQKFRSTLDGSGSPPRGIKGEFLGQDYTSPFALSGSVKELGASLDRRRAGGWRRRAKLPRRRVVGGRVTLAESFERLGATQ